jgi:hypothetical protein
VPQPVPGLPLASGVQVPRLPERLHASQLPPHAELQQTPSVQKFDAQSVFALQVCPAVFFAMHTPLLQKLPAAQPVLFTQLVGQLATLPLHA